jgi:bla regulator protein blaR1
MGRRLMLVMAVGCFGLRGQEFEAASIKPSAPMGMGMVKVGVQMLPGGRVSMSGVTAKFLIQQAYGVREFQIIGGPDWLGSDRYDITAKPEGAATPEQVKVMMQGLLADRFKLQFHRETKELPTYALVVAKGGPKFHESEVVPEGSDRPKGTRVSMKGRGQFNLERAPVAALANQLGQVLGRSVTDKTELAGNYDFKLEWTPDENSAGMMRGPGGDGPAPSPDTAGTSIFTALQEQLGLKLESTKGPVEILVIERAEKSSEN